MTDSTWTRRDFLRRSAVAGGASVGAPVVLTACGGGVEQLAVTEPFSPIINGEKQIQCGGFVFRPGDDQLRTAFDEELRKLQRSGRWVDIVSQFIGFGKENLPPDDVSTEQLCGKSQGPTQQGTTGGQGGTLARLRQQGTVTVGIANEAPYGFLSEQGEVTGEAPAVAKPIYDRLGIPRMNAEVVDFGSLIPGLNANRYTMVAAGMYITPERCANAAFSVPDYCAPSAFLVPQGNPQNITRFTDIARNSDVTLGVLSGAVEGDYARQSGVPRSRIRTFPGQNDLYEGVKAGRVYCGALTSISLKYLVRTRQS